LPSPPFTALSSFALSAMFFLLSSFISACPANEYRLASLRTSSHAPFVGSPLLFVARCARIRWHALLDRWTATRVWLFIAVPRPKAPSPESFVPPFTPTEMAASLPHASFLQRSLFRGWLAGRFSSLISPSPFSYSPSPFPFPPPEHSGGLSFPPLLPGRRHQRKLQSGLLLEG